jgi:hypothetical protein
VKCLGLNDLLLVGDIDPAALAAKVAGIDDGDIKERREKLTAFEAAFVPLDGEHALEAHVPRELPEETLVSFEKEAFRELEHHRVSIPSNGLDAQHQRDVVLNPVDPVHLV